jgi:tetratricopeptide (TPR) repeat protein
MFLVFCVASPVFWLNGSFALAQSATETSSAPRVPGTQTARPSAATRSASGDPMLGKAQSLLEKGQLSNAEATVREDLKARPQSANAHFLLGYILFREIQAGARRYDPHPDAVYSAPSQSLVELRNRNAKESLAEYTAGAHFQRPSAFDLKIVSLDYILLGDSIDADKWLTLSLQWNPTDSDGWYQLGRTKYSENRFTAAIAAFKKCLALDPRNIKAEENLGLSYAGLGDDPQAVSAYQAAIAWQANAGNKDPEPYLALGALFLEQNRPKDAIPVLVQATQIAPSVSQGHESLGKAYVQTNDLPKAQIELEQAVKLSPDMARLHYILGQVYRKEGFAAKAKAEFDRCAALQGTRGSDPTTM